MKEIVRYGLTLSFICVAASASLAVVNSMTKARIAAQAKAEEEASMREVMPAAKVFQPVTQEDEVSYYKAYDKDGEFLGIVFKASARGYSSMVDTVAGLTKTGVITAIKVVSQTETPGLGTQITEPSFRERFSGKNIRDLKDIQAIARVTISSKAVIDSVNKRAQELREVIKDGR